MRKQLYLDIKNKLAAIENEDGEPIFKFFDLWNQQVEFLEEETSFVAPAVFVEFEPINWRTLGMNVQDAQLTVRLHIVTEWFSGTYSTSPTEQDSLEFLDLIDKVVYALQGFATSYMNGWMRSKSITNHDHFRYVDNIEEYICNLRDVSAVREMVPVEAEFVINNE